MQALKDYIESYYGGSQSSFARAARVERQQVTQWIKKGFMEHDHVLYSKRRELISEVSNDVIRCVKCGIELINNSGDCDEKNCNYCYWDNIEG